MPRLVAIAGLLALAGFAAPAGATEHRTYSVFVDGKEVGQSSFRITEQDGTTYVAAAARVEVKVLIVKFTYEVQSQEWWKGGRLVATKTEANDNGKKTEVTVVADGDRLRTSVNGEERVIRGDAWTSSYWKLADPKFHNQPVPILDVDTGKEFAGNLQFVGTEQLKVAGQTQDCYRFRVTGVPSATDLWYDRFHRLVRQEFTESGHRTILQLVSIKR